MDINQYTHALMGELSEMDCEYINSLIADALKAERERCAALLDNFEIEGSDSYAQLCAEAIRALK